MQHVSDSIPATSSQLKLSSQYCTSRVNWRICRAEINSNFETSEWFCWWCFNIAHQPLPTQTVLLRLCWPCLFTQWRVAWWRVSMMNPGVCSKKTTGWWVLTFIFVVRLFCYDDMYKMSNIQCVENSHVVRITQNIEITWNHKFKKQFHGFVQGVFFKWFPVVQGDVEWFFQWKASLF